ncbi:hypothetical protein OH809_16870 [Streptomyces sp. NBC_00873]|uniref:hypothetical protein n=1 Tax=unclassified Streptomyces TaxID=2593676 RepID=UPI003869AA17|nr:hypothetical protein OH809_16870 [Streptomyces sp. NBC_00873]WTA45787.1 hypothetical protein OH821_26815 [Streptomyces sp. NBC_00842]
MPTPAIRMLPWTGPDGRVCLLVTDRQAPGVVSRVADQIEAVQLGMGVELIGHAEELLADPKADAGQVRYLAARLTEALRDAVRVAASRGARLHAPEGSMPT